LIEIKAGRGLDAIGTVEARVAGKDVAIRWQDGPVEIGRQAKAGPVHRPATSGNQLAKDGRIIEATASYAREPAKLAPHEQLARDVVGDIAHRRPAAVVAKLEKLASEGKTLSPEAHEALIGALARRRACGRPVAPRATGAAWCSTATSDRPRPTT
jgi:hypothetical protein